MPSYLNPGHWARSDWATGYTISCASDESVPQDIVETNQGRDPSGGASSAHRALEAAIREEDLSGELGVVCAHQRGEERCGLGRSAGKGIAQRHHLGHCRSAVGVRQDVRSGRCVVEAEGDNVQQDARAGPRRRRGMAAGGPARPPQAPVGPTPRKTWRSRSTDKSKSAIAAGYCAGRDVEPVPAIERHDRERQRFGALSAASSRAEQSRSSLTPSAGIANCYAIAARRPERRAPAPPSTGEVAPLCAAGF
jgi:hypothetical protein